MFSAEFCLEVFDEGGLQESWNGTLYKGM